MRILGHVAFAGVSLMALSAPAFAQGAPATEEVSNEDIIVQARRRDESLQEVPLTVNAVSAETIQKLNLRDAKDLAAVVPGLQLTPGLAVTGAVTSLRGLNVDVSNSGNNGTVEFYLNDAPVSGGVVLQSMYDVGQVEVLRGPQGTLRGRASPSGSITFTTRRPNMTEWGGYVTGTVNSLNGVNVNGAINVPIVNDVLAVRVAGLVDHNEANRVYSINNRGWKPSSKTTAFRTSVRFTPDSNFEINGTYSHLVKNYEIYDQAESSFLSIPGGTLPAGSTLVTADQRASVEFAPRRNHQAFDIFNWQAQWSFAGQRLNYVGSYIMQDLTSIETADKGAFFDASYPAVLGSYGANLHSFSRQESHEIRLSSEERLFGVADYILGAFVNKLMPSSDVGAIPIPGFSPTLAPGNFTGFAPISTTLRRGRQIERAIFGNLTVHLGEMTEVSGGVRYINYRENLNVNIGGKANSYNPVIWNASVKHRFNDDLMVYATAGSSWRIGSGTNPIILARTPGLTGALTDPFLMSLFALTPETSKSYEIGFKSTWFDKKLTLNVSAFHQDFKGYIFSGPPVYVANYNGSGYDAPGRTLSGLALPVPAKVEGMEAEIGFRPSDRFDFAATIAYAKSKIANAVVPCNPAAAGSGVPTVAQIQEGNATRQVAQCTISQSAAKTSPFSATIRAEYNHPVSDDIDGFARGLVSVYGANQNDPQNAIDNVSAYALANLYLGVRSSDGGWEIAGYAKNLLNTQRVLSRDSSSFSTTYTLNGTRATGATNYRSITMTDPREFGLTARFAFGSR